MAFTYHRKHKDTGEIQKVTVTFEDKDGEQFDTDNFMELIKNTMENRKEELEKVHRLGCCMSGSVEEASSFMIGWLAKGMITAYKDKHNIDLQIKTSTETVDNEEMIKEIPEMLRDLANKIESGEIDAGSFATENMKLNGNNVGTGSDYE